MRVILQSDGEPVLVAFRDAVRENMIDGPRAPDQWRCPQRGAHVENFLARCIWKPHGSARKNVVESVHCTKTSGVSCFVSCWVLLSCQNVVLVLKECWGSVDGVEQAHIVIDQTTSSQCYGGRWTCPRVTNQMGPIPTKGCRNNRNALGASEKRCYFPRVATGGETRHSRDCFCFCYLG